MWKQSKRYAGWHKTGERESRAVDRIANILFKYHIYYTIRQNMETNGAMEPCVPRCKCADRERRYLSTSHCPDNYEPQKDARSTSFQVLFYVTVAYVYNRMLNFYRISCDFFLTYCNVSGEVVYKSTFKRCGNHSKGFFSLFPNF